MLKKTVKKTLSVALTVILCLAAVLSFTTIIGTLVNDDPSVFGVRCFFVRTGSMEPTLPTGCLVFTKKNADGVYRAGDIITFVSEDPVLRGSSNTHRIVEVISDSDGVRYVTRGDANPVKDSYTVAPKNVQGRVVFHTGKMVWVGTVVNFVMSPPGFLLVIVLPLVLILTSSMKDAVRKYKAELEKIKKAQSGDAAEPDSPSAETGKK